MASDIEGPEIGPRIYNDGRYPDRPVGKRLELSSSARKQSPVRREPCLCGPPADGQMAQPHPTPGNYRLALPCLVLREDALTVSQIQT